MNRRTFFNRLFASTALGVGLLSAPGALATRKLLGSPFATPTFIAFLETVIPGPAHDPSGSPGALEVGTLEYFDEMDRARLLPISLLLVHSAVCHALNLLSGLRYFCPFGALSQERREALLESLSGVMGLPLLLRLARAPYYVGAVNRKGLDWIGLRLPPTEGFSRETSTWDRVLSDPEIGTVRGNLP